MDALLIFFLKLLVLPSKPKPELEAEIRAQAAGCSSATPATRSCSVHEQRPAILCSALSLVSVDPEGNDHHPAGHGGALASSGLSTLLALEVKKSGWSATDLR